MLFFDRAQTEEQYKDRNLLLLGVGLSYKPKEAELNFTEMYLKIIVQ
jgi:hypothetical protein